MSGELELVTQPMSALDVRAQVNLIQEVMKSVMKGGTHFGIQPGAKKPSLWKPGAEKLASTFRLAVDPVVEELSYGDEFRVRVKANITEMGSGRFLGAGVGECSSAETKYQWRLAVCEEEYNETPEHMRRVKWNRGDRGPYSQKQVRMNVADVANTVLKMAKKRAMIDGILTVTGASDIFTQDIEDLPDEYLNQRETRQNRSADPTPAPSAESRTEATHPVQTAEPSSRSSVISHEPDIKPKSQRTAQTTPQPPTNAPEPTQARGEALQGEVVAEPSITKPQAGRFFAIAKSVGLDDNGMKAALASIGLHCHRDSIPRSRYEEAVNAIDPEFRYHAKQ